MEKQHLLTFFCFLVYLICAFPLRSQRDIIYLKDSTFQFGTIRTEKVEGQEKFIFQDVERVSNFVLNPDQIDRFAIVFGKEGKGKSRLFISKTEQGFQDEFFERIHKGEFPIYRSTKSGWYFIQLARDRLILIPSDRAERKQLFDQYLGDNISTLGASAYAKKLSAYQRFSNFLSHPRRRYPNRYLGLNAAYGFFRLQNITANSSLGAVYPSGESDFPAQRYSVSLFINEGLNRRGNLAYHINLGARIIESQGHFESTSRITTHSISSRQAFSSLLVYHYFKLQKLSPYVGLGAEVNFPLQDESILAVFNRTEAGYDLQVDKLESLSTISYSPIIRFGLEVPISQQHFIVLESTATTVTDALNKRSLLFELSLGINIR